MKSDLAALEARIARDRAIIAAHEDERLPLADIARRVGLSAEAVRLVLIRNGVVRRPGGGARQRRGEAGAAPGAGVAKVLS